MIDLATTKSLVQSMLDELQINEITTDKYKTTILDHPWQTHIKDTNMDWYYYYSCIIVQALFSMFYMSISEYPINKVMNLLNEINDADIEDGGSGAFYIFLKKN